MSTTSTRPEKFARTEEQLYPFNHALLALKARIAGRLSNFKLSEEDAERGRLFLSDFVVGLREALKQERPHWRIRPLVCRMQHGPKSMKDWQKDLEAAATLLQQKDPLKKEDLAVLEKIRDLLRYECAASRINPRGCH